MIGGALLRPIYIKRLNIIYYLLRPQQQVACQTLSDHVNGKHKSCQDVYMAQGQWLLNVAQENTMKDWLIHKSAMATPLHPHDLCINSVAMCPHE